MVDYKKIINALDLDRVSLMGVENKKEYDIVTIKGGLNGGGDIFYYLTQIDKIVCELSADKREVWLIKWENDCADDVRYLKLGVKETKRISDIRKSISDFCKNQEDFVMKLLNLAETTSEKFFLIKEIAVHNLLPLASTIYDVPLLNDLTSGGQGEYISRHEAVYFHNYIKELCELEEISEDELADEIIDFIKEHKVIVAYYEW